MIDRNDLHALADNELSSEEQASLLRELESDANARVEYQNIVAMKTALKQSSTSPECGELWNRCQARLNELDKTKRVESFVGRYAWGICGAFFIAIVAGGFFNRSHSGSVKPNEVAGYVASLSPMSVPKSKNQSELEPMLKQVVGETFAGRPNRMQVTGLGGNAVPGRRTSVVQLSDAFGSVAVIALLDVKTVDGLYVYEQDPSFHYTTIDGVNSLFWTRGDGVICMVIGQREVSELYEIVQAMCPTKR